MSWDSIFVLTNVVAVAGWAMLLFLPRRPATHAFILFACVGLLCLAYLIMFGGLVGGWLDPARVAGAAPPNLLDYSVDGIRGLFMSDGGVVLGWTHYLAFDLFVGLWIGRDADAKGFSRLMQMPFLLGTFLAGPIGLLLWLLMRERRARRTVRAG
ncbi:ABA4-like family protein [Sphingomonas sp. GCM10030256]|uniref:ABA4-like family protein n=1 Tax=Sphingomonas sp. GCM10030256 TaxID=3273427 RepID=UPI00360B2E82